MIIRKPNPWILMYSWNLFMMLYIFKKIFLCFLLFIFICFSVSNLHLSIHFSFTGDFYSSSLYTFIKKKNNSSKRCTEYSCSICEYSTFYVFNIKRHVRLHTGELPYKCNFCSKHFNEKKSLISHVMFIHEKQM